MKTLFAQLTLLTSILIYTMNLSYGQGFVEMYPFPNLGDACRIQMNDGTEINGTWKSWTGSLKNCLNINVKSDAGEKIKLTPDQIKRIYIRISGFTKFSMLADKSSRETDGMWAKGHSEGQIAIQSIFNMVDNWEAEMKNNNEVIFELVQEKKGKYALRQMLNPGFEQKYKAFMFGYNYNEILLVDKENNQKMLRNKSYAEDFPAAFGDCPAFIKEYDQNLADLNFDNIAFHLFTYNNMCQ